MSAIAKKFEASRLTQSEVARALGVSPAAVSQTVKGKYQGDQAKLEGRIDRYLENHQTRHTFLSQKKEAPVWIETENVRSVRFVINLAARRQKMALIVGHAGSGKTSALKHIAKELPESILIESDPKMSYSALLETVCEAVGTTTKRSNAATANHLYAYFRKSRRVLLIDEGEGLSENAQEGLRRLWDKTNTPIVLVGTESLEQQILGAKREQVQMYSRIFGFHRMKPPQENELKALCQGHGVTQESVFQEIILLSEGNLRKTVWLLETMSDFAEVNGLAMEAVAPATAAQFLLL